MFKTAGLADALGRRQGQAARVDETGRPACCGTDPDRGQRLDEGTAADEGRNQRTGGVPALRHVAARSLRRMEGAGPEFYAAGFFLSERECRQATLAAASGIKSCRV